MAGGNIVEQVAIIGKIAAEGDLLGVVKAREEMAAVIVMADPFASVKLANAQVGARVAYLAGYLPAELGNEALRLFAVEHPIFGKIIPDDLDSALAAGKSLARQFALRKQIEQENAKKIKQAADLGVLVPDGEQAVTSDEAAKLLNAVRAKRARNGDALAAKEIAEMADWEKARVEKLKADTRAALLADVEPLEEDWESDEDADQDEDCSGCSACAGEEVADDPAPSVVTISTPSVTYDSDF